MRYLATVKNLDPNIEEEVTIVVEGIEILGFAIICPYQIYEGNQYPVSIGLTVLDEFDVKEISSNVKEIIRISDGFATIIRGVLEEEGFVDAGIRIQDDLLKEYAYLAGKYVEFRVDRVSIEFLENDIS